MRRFVIEDVDAFVATVFTETIHDDGDSFRYETVELDTDTVSAARYCI